MRGTEVAIKRVCIEGFISVSHCHDVKQFMKLTLIFQDNLTQTMWHEMKFTDVDVVQLS